MLSLTFHDWGWSELTLGGSLPDGEIHPNPLDPSSNAPSFMKPFLRPSP